MPTQLFPSLQSIRPENVPVGDTGWESLVTYLAHQTPANQAISFQMTGDSHTPKEVVGEIRDLVGEFVYCPGLYPWSSDDD
jgi:hypothetical protein